MIRKIILSVVVPVYNESKGVSVFHAQLSGILEKSVGLGYEIIYCDDGSNDNTASVIRELAQKDNKVKLLVLSRNFGKESALAAGISKARGDAILTLDGDGQHPVELIPRFLEIWHNGAQVVMGIRTNSSGNGLSKTIGPKLFYAFLNKVADQRIMPGASDYILIDRTVQQAFLELRETERITRGLINWIGFNRGYVYFKANARQAGTAGYSRAKLVKLAANSFVSLSAKPLYLFGYLGILITTAAFLLGATVSVEQLLLDDPLQWKFTGTAMLSILILFLVGIILMSQGILSLYISHIHSQSRGRPLYVIDYSNSVRVKNENT